MALDDKGAGVHDEPWVEASPVVGDWVMVWGQVVQTSKEGGVHPEDLMVEFFSHSEQWPGHVRRDRVIEPKYIPDFAGTCTALRETKSGALRRCTKHTAHPGLHMDNKTKFWDDDLTVGHVEE